MAAEAVARALGGRGGVGHVVHSDIDLALAVEAGLTPAAVDAIGETLALTSDEFEQLLLPKRTLRYRREHDQALTAEESDRAARLARVWVLAAETFGDDDKARTWLRRANRAIKGRVPLELLETGSGALVVEDVLTRIAYGVTE
jgi:putative toxin-antitoxin system antitoxin component (TIGR02293 family)